MKRKQCSGTFGFRWLFKASGGEIFKDYGHGCPGLTEDISGVIITDEVVGVWHPGMFRLLSMVSVVH